MSSAQVVSLYLQGERFKAIAEKTGLTKEQVRYQINKAGVNRKSVSGHKSDQRESPEADFMATMLMRAYYKAKANGLDISLKEFLRAALSQGTALREIGVMWRQRAW